MLSTLDILRYQGIKHKKEMSKITLVQSIERGRHCDLEKLIVKCYVPWIWVGCLTAERLNRLGGEGDGVRVLVARELHLEVELGIRLLLHTVHRWHPSRHHYCVLRQTSNKASLSFSFGRSSGLPISGRPPLAEACSWLLHGQVPPVAARQRLPSPAKLSSAHLVA